MIARILLAVAAAVSAVSVWALLCSDGAEDDGRCTAHTASGARCSRPSEPGTHVCWQHGG